MAASRRYKEEYIMQTFTKVGLDALVTPENCVLLLIDHQPFQLANVNSHDPTIVINNVTALARTAKAYDIPTILTTVNEERGGLIFKQVQAVFPDQKTINRTFINAWEDRRVVDAVKRIGRKKLVIAALWTEMCLAMPAIHAMGDGYDVYVLTDASGGVSPEAHDMAIRRMVSAGAQPITYGWPGSIVEFMKIIRPLTNPTDHGGRAQDAFHVVVPSLPGFGFSDKPAETGWNVSRIAFAWSELMQRLGYQRWVAQGGDWGAGTTTALAQIMPPGLVGIHLSWQFVFPEQIPEQLSFEEKRAVDGAKFFLGEGNGYFRQQSTRPQTLGYGLADSPAGQALWIYEKFQAWTDNKGLPEDALSMDQMLDNISIYWFTNSAASSARIYWENRGASFSGGKV